MNTANKNPVTILIAALGGEGGGVLAEWLVETATAAGYYAQSTSIPGVAQRTGATTYYVEVHPEPVAKLGGRLPILSLSPVPGAVDLLVASELLEAARHVQSGMVTPDRTMLITSTSRTLTTLERMQPGDGRYDNERLLTLAKRQSHRLVALNMDAITRAADTVPSAVMFGAIAASGLLPMAREQFEKVIKDSGRGVGASLRGFAQAWEQTRTGGVTQSVVQAPALPESPQQDTSPQLLTGFPSQVREMVALGLARITEYQDAAYGHLYLQRVERILAAERAADPAAGQGYALTRESARFLALWMAFDDIVRVAYLKCRASRFKRVRSEVNAGADDLLRIVDYFKPGVAELSGLLPPRLARRLTAWDKARHRAGKSSLSFPLHLQTSSISGFLALRLLASVKGMRRRGLRYQEEQVLIEKWLSAVTAAGRLNWPLAYEVALCGRMIKGYGITNERSKENLLHILDHLCTESPSAAAIRQAREAALADEAGKEFDKVLVRLGAPARPVRVQSIKWMPQRRPAFPEQTLGALAPATNRPKTPLTAARPAESPAPSLSAKD